MDITLALIKNENQVEILKFQDSKNLGAQLIDLDDLKEHKIDLLLFSKEQNSEDLMSMLTDEYKFCPVRPQEDFQITDENLKNLSYERATEVVSKCTESWTLQNNLDLLENLFPTLDHLKALWPNDRSSFMEELWFILKKNLGTNNLKIIYNSIKRGEKENEKNKLIQCRIEGKRFPETFEGEDFEKQVMDHYKSQFSEKFEISEFSKERSELVATISLKGSPIILMAKLRELTRLQQSLISSLLTGLQR